MKQKCHFIGIGGIGMSGLARLMHKQESIVSGSDVAASSLINGLIKEGIDVSIGHDAKYITHDTTVIYSTSIDKANPEFVQAQEMKCPLLHRSDLLAALMKGKKSLAVAGAHGKTTTSSLLTTVFIHAGKDPSYVIGGMISEFALNASGGKGEYFIAEADESDGSFLKYHPQGAIVTNIGRDHMDYYETKENLLSAFATFMQQVSSPELLFWCGDNKYLRQISPKGVSYGFSEHCALRAHNFEQKGWKVVFDATFEGKDYPNIEVPLIGEHNALNALAVFGLALRCGIPEKTIREGLLRFKGVHRRCEIKGEVSGTIVIDDYAHHPTEISNTLHALRSALPDHRLIVLFQPHRYTRVRDCIGSFAGIFDEADEVVVTEIYSAGEAPLRGISHNDILEENTNSSSTHFEHIPTKQIVDTLVPRLRSNDVVVTLGAGDITHLGPEILSRLRQHG